MANLLQFNLDPYSPTSSVKATRAGYVQQPEQEDIEMTCGYALADPNSGQIRDAPAADLADWIPIPCWMTQGLPLNEEEKFTYEVTATNSQPSTPADILIAWKPSTEYPNPNHIQSTWRLYLDDEIALDLSQARTGSALPHPAYPLNADGLIELKNRTFTTLKLEVAFWYPPGGSTRTTSQIGGIFASPGTAPTPAPVANFTANPTSGKAPLTVTLTNKSTGEIY